MRVVWTSAWVGVWAVGLGVLAAALDPQPARWGPVLLWAGALGWTYGAVRSLHEMRPDRLVDHLCALHLCWAALGAVAYTMRPVELGQGVRVALVCQILANALLVPGLALWLDRVPDVTEAADGPGDRLGPGLLRAAGLAGCLAGAVVVHSTAGLDPRVARLAAIALALTGASYIRIWSHGGRHRGGASRVDAPMAARKRADTEKGEPG